MKTLKTKDSEGKTKVNKTSKFVLTTWNGLDDVMVHHTLMMKMEFDNLKDAVLAFKKEIENLENNYYSYDEMVLDDIDFTGDLVRNCEKFHCELSLLIDGKIDFESKEAKKIEKKYTSDVYYNYDY